MPPSPSDAYPRYKPQRPAMHMPQPTIPSGYGYGQYAIPHANSYYATTMTVGDHTSYTPYEPLGPPGHRRPPIRPSYPISSGYSSGSYSPTSPTAFPSSYEKGNCVGCNQCAAKDFASEARRPQPQENVSTWERFKSTITRRNSKSSSTPAPKYPRERDTEPANGIFIPPPLEPIDPKDPPRRNDVHPSLRPRPVRDRTQSFDTHNATYGSSGRGPPQDYYRSASYTRETGLRPESRGPRPESRGSRPESRGPSVSQDREYLREYRRSTSMGDPDALQADGYTPASGRRMRTNSNASRVSHVSQASRASQVSRTQSRSTSVERRGPTPEPRQTSKPAQAQAPLKGILRRTTNEDRQRAESQPHSRRPSESNTRPVIIPSPPSPSSPTTLVRLSSKPRLRPPKRGSRGKHASTPHCSLQYRFM